MAPVGLKPLDLQVMNSHDIAGGDLSDMTEVLTLPHCKETIIRYKQKCYSLCLNKIDRFSEAGRKLLRRRDAAQLVPCC